MKLEKIEQAVTVKGNTYNKLTIDGKTYNFFGDMLNLQVGDDVLCQFKVSGKFTNLESIEKVTTLNPTVPALTQTQLNQHDVVIQRTDRPHSFEFGKATERHKIYYNSVEELSAHIDMLRTGGFIEPVLSEMPTI